MNIFFLIFFIEALILESPKNIVIDVTKVDRLKLSEIAEYNKVIPLSSGNIKLNSISKILLVEDKIFLKDNFQIDGMPNSRVLQFDLEGNYLNQIGIKEPGENAFMKISAMEYNETNNTIFLYYLDGYGEFDINGKLLTFYKKNTLIEKSFPTDKYIFQGKFWSTEYSYNNGIKDYSLVQMDFGGQKKDTVKSLKYKLLKGESERSFSLLGFSIHCNELYVSTKNDNTIYKVKNNTLHPTYKFEFKNYNPSFSEKGLSFSPLIIDHYLYYSYFIKAGRYDFIYDLERDVSYNIKILSNQHGLQVSGIEDDLLGSGFFSIKRTNKEEFIYFIKNQKEVPKNNFKYLKKADKIVFLVKLK